jgi:hypothetical protein
MAGMVPRTGLRASTRPVVRRERRHGAVLDQVDRRALERAGWRTTLEFRENNIRARDGLLLQVETIWHAEAERDGPADRSDNRRIDLIVATAETLDGVWSKLRLEAELADVRRLPGERAAAS